jgi:hypothetical protein
MRVRINVPHLFKTAGGLLVTVSTAIGKGVMRLRRAVAIGSNERSTVH